MKHKTRNPMPVGVAVFFIVAGLFLGSIFTFGMQFWGDSIEREDAIFASANFESYQLRYGRSFNVSEIILRFDNHFQLCIDSACVSEMVLEEIKELPEGAKVDMLVHPNSDTVLELKYGDKTILAFEESQRNIKGENIGFGFLGIFLYFCAVLGLGSLLIRWSRAKNKYKCQN